LFVPPLYSSSFLDRCDLTRGSRAELRSPRKLLTRKGAINHTACAFTENKRYRTKPRRLSTW
jgi:hypothetical protein